MSFLKYHLHFLFLEKSLKSLFKSDSLINEGVGVNPNSLPKTLTSVSDKTLLLRFNTTSELS